MTAAARLLRPGAAPTLDELIADRITELVTDAIDRAEARGEVRRTHYSPAEVATAIGVSESHVRNCLADGTLPGVRLGERWLVARSTLEALA